ncbi:MAG: cell filamentation protein Fic [Pseudomonadales bacterium]|nr:cell filamentation protein Fic [Pseudomonadales bacterium]
MSADPYFIPGTTTLRNLAGIINEDTLAEYVREASAVRLFELDANPLDLPLDFKYLLAIHQHIFQDVFTWAGRIRTIGMSKGTTQFEWPERIERYANTLFDELRDEQYLVGLARDEFIARAAHYLNEINVLHPFREGNGRAQRAYFDHLAAKAGFAFQWSNVTPKEMIDASIHGFAVDTELFEDVLNRCLLD